jgi:hypothetical protein
VEVADEVDDDEVVDYKRITVQMETSPLVSMIEPVDLILHQIKITLTCQHQKAK